MTVVSFATLVALALAAGAHAAPAKTSEAEPKAAVQIRATLAERFPGVRIEGVRTAPVAGLYEVYIGSEIVYVDARAEHLLSGKLLTTTDKRNLTAERWDEFNRIDFASLPVDAAIKTVRGNGTRKLAVFSDPDCPFCRKLEQELASVDDVTIYVFLFPLEQLHKGATARSRTIWCSADRAEAWRAWMVEQKQPATAECAMDPVAGNQALAGKLHVTVTPTMFFSDGSRMTGAVSAADLGTQLVKRSGDASAAGPPTAASR